MTTPIKFGTDGWRGLIADDFTFENVRRVAGAIASYVLKYEEPKRGIIVGYDTRFASPRAARIVAEVIAEAGIPVKLANDYTPTPAVSYAVKRQGAAGGVMVTSSHNPSNWNGVKFKASFGGSATPAIMKKIEEELAAGAAPKSTTAAIDEVDLKKAYIAAVCAFADMDLIAKTKFKPMELVAFQPADATALPFADASFDVVVCQFGVMFFDEPVRAFANIRSHLRPDARMAFVCWQPLQSTPQ